MVPLNLFSTLFNPSSESLEWDSDLGKECISAAEDFIDQLANADSIRFLRGDPIFDSMMEYASKNYDAKTLYGNLNWFLADLEQNLAIPLHIDRISDNKGDPYVRYTFMSIKMPYVISWVRNFHDRLYVSIHTPKFISGVEMNICRNGEIIKEEPYAGAIV